MGSEFEAIWEDPEGVLYQIHIKKSFKTRPNTPYGGETSSYSLLQGGVHSRIHIVCKVQLQKLQMDKIKIFPA